MEVVISPLFDQAGNLVEITSNEQLVMATDSVVGVLYSPS